MPGRSLIPYALPGLVMALLTFAGVHPATATVPGEMSYQGFITDLAGVPRSGVLPMRFALYADSMAGAPLWSESHAGVAVENGAFSVRLGSLTPVPAAVFDGGVRWIETTINDTTLSPRRPVMSIAYAFRSALADSAVTSPFGLAIDSAEIADGTIVDADVAPAASIAGTKIHPDFGAQELRTTGALHAGLARVTGFEMPTGATAGYVLTADGAGTGNWQPAATGTIGGAGVPNQLSRFSGPQTIASSIVTEAGGNIGIGTVSPSARLDVAGGARVTAFNLPVGAQSGYVLTSNAIGDASWQPVPSSGVGGGGTPGSIPLFTGSFTLGNSSLTESAGRIGVGTPVPLGRLHVTSASSGSAALVVQGAPGQGASIQEWRDGSGVVRSSISSLGAFSGDGSYLTGLNASSLQYGTVRGDLLSGSYTNPLQLTSMGNSFYGNGSGLVNLSASSITSGSLAVTQMPTYGTWTLSNNLSLYGGVGSQLYLDLNGRAGFGTQGPQARLHVIPPSPGIKGLIVQATGGQGVNLQEWQNAGGGILGYVDPTGVLSINGSGISSLNAGSITNGTLNASRLPSGGAWPLSSTLNIGGMLSVESNTVRVGSGPGSTNAPLTIMPSETEYDIITAGTQGLDITTASGGGAITISAQRQSSQGLIIAANNNIGIRQVSPGNILTVQQNSATDPIADAWTTYSSRRWKTNIVPMSGALATVLRLQGVTFDWKETGRHDIGMIAEEVGQVVPEVVAFEENGRDAKSIDYARLTALLVEAVKSLQAENDALKARVEAIERGNPGGGTGAR
jgi:hypothetical protein